MSRRRSYSPDTLRRIHAKWDLEEARWAYWSGDYNQVLYLLLKVMDAIVKEPDPHSQEYKNGEGKLETAEPEKEEGDGDEGDDDEEEERSGLYSWLGIKRDINRDDDGYLIR